MAVHLFLAALASGIPLILSILEWKTNRRYKLVRNISLAKTSAVMLVIVGGSGVLIGWLKWDSELSLSLQRTQSRFVFGIIEYFFSLGLIVGYWFWSRRQLARFLLQNPEVTNEENDLEIKQTNWQKFFRSLLLFVAATNLLYHFPMFFLILRDLQVNVPNAPLSSSDYRSLIFQWPVIIPWAHFVGNSIMLASLWCSEKIVGDGEADSGFRSARRLSSVAALISAVQWLIGIQAFQWIPRQKLFEVLDWTSIWMLLLVPALVNVAILNWVLWLNARHPSIGLSRFAMILTFIIVVLMTTFSRSL